MGVRELSAPQRSTLGALSSWFCPTAIGETLPPTEVVWTLRGGRVDRLDWPGGRVWPDSAPGRPGSGYGRMLMAKVAGAWRRIWSGTSSGARGTPTVVSVIR